MIPMPAGSLCTASWPNLDLHICLSKTWQHQHVLDDILGAVHLKVLLCGFMRFLPGCFRHNFHDCCRCSTCLAVTCQVLWGDLKADCGGQNAHHANSTIKCSSFQCAWSTINLPLSKLRWHFQQLVVSVDVSSIHGKTCMYITIGACFHARATKQSSRNFPDTAMEPSGTSAWG